MSQVVASRIPIPLSAEAVEWLQETAQNGLEGSPAARVTGTVGLHTYVNFEVARVDQDARIVEGTWSTDPEYCDCEDHDYTVVSCYVSFNMSDDATGILRGRPGAWLSVLTDVVEEPVHK